MSYCHITRFDLMHVTETGPALRHLGQSFPFQQTISTQATSYLCAVRHATQRSAPGANTRAPTLPPHVITDREYGGIEYGGLPVNCGRIRYHVVLHSNSMLANLPII
jgi:hypothetical protein